MRPNTQKTQQLSLLPPASCWIVSDGGVTRTTYFRSNEWESQAPTAAPEYFDEFLATWKAIVPRYLRGGPPVGLSLTGGVDSRMILACSPRDAEELITYTFNGRYRECADVRISRQLARASRHEHYVINLGAPFLQDFPELAAQAVYLSDGSVDVRGAIDLYVQREMRRISPVRVTGTNGGEILRSIVNISPSAVDRDLFANDLHKYMDAAVRTCKRSLRESSPRTFAVFKQTPWYMAPKFALERLQLTLRMPYLDNDFVALAYRAPLGTDSAFSLAIIAAARPELAPIPTDRTLSGNSKGLIDRWLRDISFKVDHAYDDGLPTWLTVLDRAFAPFHPERMIAGRHKIHHFRLYYRDDLAPFVRDVLLDPATLRRSHLSPRGLTMTVESHLSGARNRTRQLHRLLTLELIHRTLLAST